MFVVVRAANPDQFRIAQSQEGRTWNRRRQPKRQVPLSVSQREVIANLQKWLNEGRAQPASSHREGSGVMVSRHDPHATGLSIESLYNASE